MIMNTPGFEAAKHSGSKPVSPYPIGYGKSKTAKAMWVFFFPHKGHLIIQPKALQIRFWFVFLTLKLLWEENNMKES